MRSFFLARMTSFPNLVDVVTKLRVPTPPPHPIENALSPSGWQVNESKRKTSLIEDTFVRFSLTIPFFKLNYWEVFLGFTVSTRSFFEI